MICGGITMEEISIQSMCACAASVRETSTSETTPSLIRTSTTPGSPFRSDRAPSICGRVMSPPSSRALSTYSSLCCTGGRDAWVRSLRKPAKFPVAGNRYGCCAVPTSTRSFHSYAFGEVPWLIDISAEFDCEVIGEKLKRDDGQDGHYVLGRFRQHDDFIGDLFEVLGTVSAGHGDNRSLAGFHLFDVVHVFRENGIIRCNEYRG